jgi:hypothetical protein
MIKRHYLLLSFVMSLTLSMVFLLSAHFTQQQQITLKTAEIEKQIALDLPLLDIANEFLNHSGDQASVDVYINKLNAAVGDNALAVVQISSLSPVLDEDNASQFVTQLKTNNTYVYVTFDKIIPLLRKVDIVFIILFVGLGFVLTQWLNLILQQTQVYKQLKINKNQQIAIQNLMLIIDLNNKTVTCSCAEHVQVALANKPLCFYLALVEYCLENNDVVLNQNKYVPEELITLANKYFYRLIELGHTIRKRPNFNNSLDKTLSEIRAALDEVLNDHPELKPIYYPPKAYGEGSRSRVHSYGLKDIAKGKVEVKGK